ncbi:hypothetical protein BA022_15695 [Diaphorobacter nitroreducens]|uniref:hypothetical protein n=1 Tax=Diaphorobacter nitroreducens TaxID=164759 RepID=UPI000B5A120F|nr:hypothetical protein [Diaphorobacter nitroreducens]ASI69862.1 hypothetical protein BA022_15695 [Diaphorobacter nitroreducens]
MIDVVNTSFYLKAPFFDKGAFERYSSELFDEWDSQVGIYLNLPDYALTLVLEEGSIKGRGTIAAAVAALYIGIGEYGDFVSGLRTIHEQASYVSAALFQEAKERFACTSERGNTKRTDGEIVYLRRLFERVQAGAVTPDQAVEEVRSRWGEEASNSPEFLSTLASSLEAAPRHPDQLTLSDESWPDCLLPETLERDPQPRAPRRPELPIPQHYRIEISRPSRGEQKKVKLTKVR